MTNDKVRRQRQIPGLSREVPSRKGSSQSQGGQVLGLETGQEKEEKGVESRFSFVLGVEAGQAGKEEREGVDEIQVKESRFSFVFLSTVLAHSHIQCHHLPPLVLAVDLGE